MLGLFKVLFLPSLMVVEQHEQVWQEKMERKPFPWEALRHASDTYLFIKAVGEKCASYTGMRTFWLKKNPDFFLPIHFPMRASFLKMCAGKKDCKAVCLQVRDPATWRR